MIKKVPSTIELYRERRIMKDDHIRLEEELNYLEEALYLKEMELMRSAEALYELDEYLKKQRGDDETSTEL